MLSADHRRACPFELLAALAGVSHAASNSFPLLMLAGASESFQANQGAFQEMDQVSFLKGETKSAFPPPSRFLCLSARDTY